MFKLGLLLFISSVATYYWLETKRKIKATVRPELNILERWYQANAQRRRVIGVVLDWPSDRIKTQDLIDTLVKRFSILKCQYPNGSHWSIKRHFSSAIEILNEEQEWKVTVENLLSTNPESAEPLWKIVLNTQTRCLFVLMDHMLTDGIGLARFIQSLRMVEKFPYEDYPQSLDAVKDLTASLSFFGKTIISRSLQSDFFVGPLPSFRASEEKGTILDSTSFSAKIIQPLITKCRSKGTTLHGIISASACMSLFHMLLPLKEKTGSLRMKLDTPISLRTQINKQTGVLGNLIAPCEQILELNVQTSVWDLGKSIREHIVKAIPYAHENIGLLAFVKDFQEFQNNNKNSQFKGRLATIEVSNLGKIDCDLNWYFAQGNHYPGPLFAVNVVTCGSSGTLFLTVTAFGELVSREDLRQFTKGIEHQLLLA